MGKPLFFSLVCFTSFLALSWAAISQMGIDYNHHSIEAVNPKPRNNLEIPSTNFTSEEKYLPQTALVKLQKQLDLLTKNQERLTDQIDRLTAINASERNPLSFEVLDDYPQDSDGDPDSIKLDQMVSNMEENFRTEPNDSEWSEQALTVIEEQFAESLAEHSLLVDSDCRRSFCRLEVSFSEPENIDDLIENLSEGLGWNTDMHIKIIEESDNEVRTVVFLSRDGYELPGIGEH